jgi:hypothetical protein
VNRRGFLAALFAPFVARFLPFNRALMVTCVSSWPRSTHPLADRPYVIFQEEITLEEFHRRYLSPHQVRFQNEMDRMLLEGYKIGSPVTIKRPSPYADTKRLPA